MKVELILHDRGASPRYVKIGEIKMDFLPSPGMLIDIRNNASAAAVCVVTQSIIRFRENNILVLTRNNLSEDLEGLI